MTRLSLPRIPQPTPMRWRDWRLAVARALIDRIDAGVVALAAARRQAVRVAAACKPPCSARDRDREARVHAHALGVANDVGLPAATATRLLDSLIRDACDQQGYPSAALPPHAIPDTSAPDTSAHRNAMTTLHPVLHRLARLLPPPHHLSPLLRRVPQRWHASLLQQAMRRALAEPVQAGELDFLATRTIGIHVTDLGLSWAIGLRGGQLAVVDDPAQATVQGSLTDLMLLASRAEDADTLFFQRRLILTGDTELGLLARNTLDRLDWERIPLGMRILLHRSARLACAARAAWRDAHTAGTDSHPGAPFQ